MPQHERRSTRRYPIAVELQYNLKRNKSLESGHGHTVNISSGGVLFSTECALPPGFEIELAITWPARLGGVTRLKMHVQGLTVRNEENRTAVKIFRYQYRTSA
jgi:hypothetical protein